MTVDMTHFADLAKIDIRQEPAQFHDGFNAAFELIEAFARHEFPEAPLDMELVNTFRPDEAAPPLPREKLLQGAPAVEAGCVSVPKILGRGE